MSRDGFTFDMVKAVRLDAAAYGPCYNIEWTVESRR